MDGTIKKGCSMASANPFLDGSPSLSEIGEFCHAMATSLFPICRSLTGPGVRETLAYLQQRIPQLEVRSVPTGTNVFDWTVPEEWVVREAYIEDEHGSRIVDFKENNLHLVGYSIPVNETLDLEDLQKYLHSLPDQPDAIPYITSYYSKRWGFCLTENQRRSLKKGKYRVHIDSELKDGELNFGELVIPGKSSDEVFISTYICHPSMANNELSGPVVATAIACWLNSLTERHFTYRIIFIPETIGSITYISQNLKHMQEHITAGFNLTCIGDEGSYSYLPSRAGDTLSDRVVQHVMKHVEENHIAYSWLDRGSDERQYCAPGIDLPIVSIMRTKYGEFPEYHTSLDDLEFVTPNGLAGGFDVTRKSIKLLEANIKPKVSVLGEPQLGKRGLYPTLSTKESGAMVRTMMNLISYSDGQLDLLSIADKINAPYWELLPIIEKLIDADLMTVER
ncbi:MAG: DUF4910 domain-containing protein [Rhizobiaceae bacterium]